MEYVDVLDENGYKTGMIKPMREVHRDGDWHRTVHIWFANSRGDLLLQLRSKESYLSPDCWDISAAGHVSAGGESLEYAMKETKEELGIELVPGQLQFLATIKDQSVSRNEQYGETVIHNEFGDVYLVRMDLPVEDFTFTDGEVQKVQWVPWHTLKQWMVEQKPDLVSHPEEYMLLFNILNSQSHER